MTQPTRFRPLNTSANFAICGLLAGILTACGGGSGSDAPAADAALAGDSALVAPAPPSPDSATPPNPTPIAAPDQAQPSLPMPMSSGIANGSTLQLECGRTYVGTLDLSGKANVKIMTAGGCGNAVLTPGQAISGWTRYQGNIYSAAIGFDAAQVIADGQPLERAHWPSRAQTWARASASDATSLSYPMPNADLVGATLLFRSADWYIGARKITGYSSNTMTLASTGNLSFEDYPLSGQPDFYVEGKLWMLDEPGEWAVKDGRLYVWMPDGQSPEGRIWASPDKDGIDARNSSAVTIEGVKIFGAANGINALGAIDLRVNNAEIANSSENGIQNSGGRGLAVDRTAIRNTRHDAIVVRWGGGAETITNSTVDASGTLGMPTNARAAIDLLGSGAQVIGNSVTRSGYIGVRVFSNAAVRQNRIDGACLVLTDCGGIYLAAPDRQALNSVVDGNTIVNVGGTQRLAWAIDLDDGANAVTVSNNLIAGNANGMQINGGFNNTFSGNRFSASVLSHVQMNEDGAGPSVRNNVFRGNSFVSKNGEETYRLGSTLGASSVAQFGSYDGNSYASSSTIFANFNGAQFDFTQWKAKTGQDASSTFQAP